MCERRRPDGTLVFTDTTEFTSRLQARLTERARGRAEAAVRAASSEASLLDMQALADLDDPSEPHGSHEVGSATTKQLSTQREGNGENEEHDDDDDNLSVMDIEEHPQHDEEDDVDEDDQMAFVHHQPLASSGNSNPHPNIDNKFLIYIFTITSLPQDYYFPLHHIRRSNHS